MAAWLRVTADTRLDYGRISAFGVTVREQVLEAGVEDGMKPERKRLIRSDHRKRPLGAWVVPLVIILVIMIFLPKLVAFLEK